MAMSLLRFTRKVPATPPGPTKAVKYGLYPLGEGEVIMSTPTFEVIVHLLSHGTPEDRGELATALQAMYNSPFTPGGGLQAAE